MIEVEHARRRIIEGVWTGQKVKVETVNSIGCYTSDEIRARHAIPSYDQSAVDGYALNHDDLSSGSRLSVVGSIRAGDEPNGRINKGEAMRLFTGAPVPYGSIGVVMQESVKLSQECTELTLLSNVKRGEWIRRKGSAVCIGQSIAGTGSLVTPALIGLLASQGQSQVTVGSKPRISVVSTGNELAQLGSRLGAGQIYDSNGPMIEALCRQQGLPSITRYTCQDTLAATKKRIATATEISDIIVLTGGVSVGEYDFVKPALVESGFSIDFWRVRMKPGKPFLFGRRIEDRKIVLGLPGNPVSAFVTFALFAVPAIRRWMGARPGECQLPSLSTLMAGDVFNSGDRPQFVRGTLDEDGFRPFAGQESHALRSAVCANALLRVEPDSSFRLGDRVSPIALR